MTSWQSKARQRLKDHAADRFNAWAQTKDGKKWRAAQYRPPRVRNGLDGRSPYAWGFELPEHHYDLIQALNEDDEEQAKYLMLVHFITPSPALPCA